jgi:NAD(P)H-hydrate epimerase
MIAAGSINYTGAVLLAGEAAYRSGAGLVRMAIPGPLHAPLAGQIPEATWLLLPHETSVIAAEAAAVLSRNLDGVDALLVGCGMGQEDTTAEFMRRLLAGEGPRSARPPLGFLPGSAESNRNRSSLPPLVIDADGLRLLARVEDWPSRLPPGSVLTPHPGEMSALTGLSVADLQAERLDVAVRFAKEWQQVVVLKGALTVVALPDGSAHIVPVATAALARAGTGDVLAGLICGLIAQGLPPGEAARAGAWLHAQAGLAALEGTGHSASVLARDVLLAIGDVLAGLK